ncbi:uncharacterized protein C9orf85 homolog [Sitophilus oryzae]|uniref:Uncharacterized protein C9orf85 homolog n=1 Tax=Sitophilus oryzae TaxID=7048 RepID=A0A6J2XJK2_SITOR|nr:uncharacterized protein C9orf85 homolog [Sitophilus oryzae]XP_030751105.1 uncharacterized protein C9orf85 homolog [Sitophilus oryzae]XP_030751106.1 uncharacterized protein C9orf85 homolog [Sitophilus oryzae]
MSSQRGNSSRSRPQKHQNKAAFKNNLYDTSTKTKVINSIQVGDVCKRCKDIIEWKIKYKKYKPLSQPKKCVKCGNKSVKRAYNIMCLDCAHKLGVCAKCGQSKEIIQSPPSEQDQIKLDEEMKELLKSLPERKRRTFIRFMNKSSENPVKEDAEKQRKDLVDKLKTLKVNEEDDFDDFSDDDDTNLTSDSEENE